MLTGVDAAIFGAINTMGLGSPLERRLVLSSAAPVRRPRLMVREAMRYSVMTPQAMFSGAAIAVCPTA